ncbi:hypothetical protein LJR290_007463 [Variovorax sp. LjRoot290]|uniref:hypothetical protein n=1 Tax=Variovorax sp. LjRoot290 TaxID=3342316 RepID=UPI003ECEC3B1
MPVLVKAVRGKPYGKTSRFCLQIESGYRAGHVMEHSGVESPMHWRSRAEAEQWARDTGYTVGAADRAASTKLLVNLFETFSDFQFEDRDISGAVLVDDLGRWLREHKAEVACMAAPKADPGAQKLKGLFRMCRALHTGDAEVNGGDLVDIFGEWLRETQELMPGFTGAPFVPRVAKAPDGTAYWSERHGWGELGDATVYFETAPWGLTTDVTAEWVDAELATELLAEAEAEAAPRG